MTRRRRTLYLALGVLAVVIGSVAFDIGHSATRADRASDLRALASQVKSDLASCNASLNDSFSAYTAVLNGRHDELSAAEGIIRGDAPECTPVENSDLYDLATLEATPSLRAYNLQPAMIQFGEWAYPDANGVMTDLAKLLSDPTSATAKADAVSRLAQMTQLSRSAEGSFGSAATRLGTGIPGFNLGPANGEGTAGL